MDNSQIFTLKTKCSELYKLIEKRTKENPVMQIIRKVDDPRLVRKLRSFFPRKSRNSHSLYLRITNLCTLNQLAMEVAVLLEICSYKQLKKLALIDDDSAWNLVIGHFIFQDKCRLTIYIDYTENLTNQEWDFLSKIHIVSWSLDAKISLILFVNE